MNTPTGILDSFLNNFPLWLVAIFIVALCLLAREAGVRFARRTEAGKAPGEERGSAADGHIVSTIFGLLAFIVGLTFSIALDRYDSRRGLVTEEANAISTTYLRASLFDEPHVERLQALLRAYAHSRIAPSGVWDERAVAQLQRSMTIRSRIWEASRAALLPVRRTDQASYYLEAMDEMFNVGTHRQLLGRSHIPTRILDVLLIYLLIASAVLGYVIGTGPASRRPAAALLFILFTIAIVVIFDLDRPQSGGLQVPQTAIRDLIAELDRDAARAAEGGARPGPAQPGP